MTTGPSANTECLRCQRLLLEVLRTARSRLYSLIKTSPMIYFYNKRVNKKNWTIRWPPGWWTRNALNPNRWLRFRNWAATSRLYLNWSTTSTPSWVIRRARHAFLHKCWINCQMLIGMPSDSTLARCSSNKLRTRTCIFKISKQLGEFTTPVVSIKASLQRSK